MKVIRKNMVAAAALLLAATLPSGAFAQKKPRTVIKLSVTQVEGRIQKPQAFYILQRSNLNFEGLELKKSFVPKIISSVDQAPF